MMSRPLDYSQIDEMDDEFMGMMERDTPALPVASNQKLLDRTLARMNTFKCNVCYVVYNNVRSR